MRGKAAGTQRERAVVHWYRDRDWIAQRGAASLGVDVIALKAGQQPEFCEVKSSAQGPYEHFGPADRAHLLSVAEMAGARPLLVWWPPRGEMRRIGAEEWPVPLREAA